MIKEMPLHCNFPYFSLFFIFFFYSMTNAVQQSNGEIHLFTAGMGTYGLGKFDDCLNVKAMVKITKGTETRKKLLRGRFCDVSFRVVELNESEIENGIDQLGGNPITLFEFLTLHSKKITPIDSGETGLTTDFNFLDPRYLPTGFCVPSACTSKDVRHAVARLVGSHALPNIFGLNSRLARIVTYSSDDYCVAEDDPRKPFSAADIAVISILSVIGFLVASATLHELVRMHFFSPIDTNTESMEVRVLHCFSAVNNTRKLLTTRPSSDNLGCVHGIRVLSTTWVVMGHTYFILLFTPVVTNITLGDVRQSSVYG